MKTFLSNLTEKYFGEQLDFRARIFNAGMFIISITWMAGGITAIVSARGESFAGYPALICVVSIAWLIWYANKSGNYKLCYCIVTVGVFMVQAAIGFFLNGGYKGGGVFTLFIINTAIAAFLFEGKKAIIVPLILIVEYVALCIFAYYYPDLIRPIGERKLLPAILIIVTTCASLATVIILHLRFHEKQNRELEEARRKAVEYEKQNRALVAEMSHELRTPLAVMSGYALYSVERIKTKGVTDETLADLSAISEEAGRLAKMADDTLAILRSSGEIDNSSDKQKSLVDISAVVRKIIALQKPVAERIGLDLEIEIENNLPKVMGDAGELSQIIWNILQNAIIHSSADTVSVFVRMDDNNVLIIFDDDGDGIDDEHLRNIFERGACGNDHAKKAGLGLPISRDIARRHGGDISIESQLNKGTRVIVSLPSCQIENKIDNQKNSSNENDNNERDNKEKNKG